MPNELSALLSSHPAPVAYGVRVVGECDEGTEPWCDVFSTRVQALDAITEMDAENFGEQYEVVPLYAPVAAQPVIRGEWMPIETAPKGRTVLVHYKNRLGRGRTMRACYYLAETLDSDTEESGWAHEGWYEESEAYEYLMPLEGEPTHWMPLPPPPAEAQSSSCAKPEGHLRQGTRQDEQNQSGVKP